jgi:hypothetical protein
MLKIEELENSSFIVVAEGVENFGRGRFFLNFCCCHLGRFFLRQGLSSTWSTLGCQSPGVLGGGALPGVVKVSISGSLLLLFIAEAVENFGRGRRLF